MAATGSREEYVAFLEDQVHRLNLELARYQRAGEATQARPLGNEWAMVGDAAAFLLDAERLPPLIHAYEEQVRPDLCTCSRGLNRDGKKLPTLQHAYVLAVGLIDVNYLHKQQSCHRALLANGHAVSGADAPAAQPVGALPCSSLTTLCAMQHRPHAA